MARGITRRGFLAALGVGVAAIVALPKIGIGKIKEKFYPKIKGIPPGYRISGWWRGEGDKEWKYFIQENRQESSNVLDILSESYIEFDDLELGLEKRESILDLDMESNEISEWSSPNSSILTKG